MVPTKDPPPHPVELDGVEHVVPDHEQPVPKAKPIVAQVGMFVPEASLHCIAGRHVLMPSQLQPPPVPILFTKVTIVPLDVVLNPQLLYSAFLPSSLQLAAVVIEPALQRTTVVVKVPAPEGIRAHVPEDQVQPFPAALLIVWPMAPQLVPPGMLSPELQVPSVHCVAAIHVLVEPDTPNLQPVPSAAPTAAHAALLTAPLAQADTG